ncbi:MAG: HD domain-containing phosphohydrolase [Candidatus Thiodiazotropha sp. 6PLUC9]
MKANSNEKACVLIIDDEKFYIDVLVEILKEEYRVLISKDGQQGITRATNRENPPDLILLDIVMPNMDGYEVCKKLKENHLTSEIPIIFLTIKSEVDDEVKGFNLGAVDYITKPISPPIVKSRVSNHLALARSKKLLNEENLLLESRVRERTSEIRKTQDVAICCMASLAETRDSETGYHIQRTQHYIKILCEELQNHPDYRDYLTADNIDRIVRSAPLHDIGKVGIPDSILLKPGKLNEDEWNIMSTHAQLGFDALLNAEKDIGTTSFLGIAKEVALTHHEKWDGSGYPNGLKGDEIPVSGRLMALADVYDALVNKRVYKDAYKHQTAVKVINEGSGLHFDPVIVSAFLELEAEFKRILDNFSDN